MRYNFDLSETETQQQEQQQRALTPSTPSKEEVEWVPLHDHPVFGGAAAHSAATSRTHSNLLAWDGASRLYFWDSDKQCLHRLSVRLGDPEPASVIAASPSKVLQPDVQMKFVVNKISINRNGSALLLTGSDGLCIMHLYGRTSAKDNTIICRTVTIASQIYFDNNNFIRTLQVSWHPYSDTHLGILSSDSVLRLFDLSSGLEQPEQEYYLQPVEPGQCRNAASICPVSFSFGGDHLWDRFSVSPVISHDVALLILDTLLVILTYDYSDGSIYILCPVVPFGSVYRGESIGEMYSDAHVFGLKSSNSRAVSNSSLAISWLEATFPEIAHQTMEGGNLSALKAHPYAPFDASLSLQISHAATGSAEAISVGASGRTGDGPKDDGGCPPPCTSGSSPGEISMPTASERVGPLPQVCHDEEEKDSEVRGTACEGRAVGFLYNSISKDSVLVTAWSSGQLQIDALADEIQPVWNVGSPPRLCVDSHDRLLGLAMICESNPCELSFVKLDQPLDHTVWLGHPPPLLRMAVVDLALPRNTDSGSLLSMFADPLIPERIYCLHGGGIDSIVLHFLPFTSQTSGKDETMRAPSVYPVLNTCQGETCSPSPLCAFVALSDSFGYSWIVGVTSSRECIVLEMKSWNMLLPLQVDLVKKAIGLEEQLEMDTPDIISKELLTGPKVVLIPQASQNLRSITVDSIEGRSTLHQYFKLFHENYVEYAHKVYFELKHHGAHLKKIIDDQHARLREVQQKLLKVEDKQLSLEDRINRAVPVHQLLEERLQNLRNLPGPHKKPLSRAEREFKSELDRFTELDLDALHSSIEALNARLRRYTQSPQGNASNPTRQLSGRRRNQVSDAQISHLRSSIAKLSLINSENSKKVKLVESALRSRESSD
ncbi:hypothetical protein HHK36_018572 [Tetracentron sinense]|uniref:Nuclear pore complex protein Nup88 n=1 Tax=Tetracentron sinense TaxID=13715 RepID=A0A834Z4M2_TETSI|nr:hypothetical protein HHK36_018572 [Tetracentron sinense]